MSHPDALLMVGGSVLRTEQGVQIPRGHDELVEISAEDVPGLAEVLAAATPAPRSQILARLARSVDETSAREALDALVAAGVLIEVVPAAARITRRGTTDFQAAVAHAMAGLYWPVGSPPVVIELLGMLGTAGWHQAARASGDAGTRVVTCTLERDGTGWVLPLQPELARPCPLCLGARRTAVMGPISTGEPLRADPKAIRMLAWHAVHWGAAQELPPGAVLQVRGASTRARTLIPFAPCGRCGRPASIPDAEQVARRYRALLDAPEGPELAPAQRDVLLDPELGPFFMSVLEVTDAFRELPLVVGGLRTLQPTAGGMRRQVLDTSFGAGLTEGRARLVCLVETIERHAALMEPPDVRGKTYAELGAHAVDPATVIAFTDGQHARPGFPFQRYGGQQLDWAWTYELTRGTPALLPFDALAARGWDAEDAPFQLLKEPTSHGTAVHRSFARAALRGLMEWIERDALLLAWYLQLPLPELNPTFDEDTAAVHRHLVSRGIRLRFFNLAVDLKVPTVLCLARADVSRGRWPAGGHVVSACSAAAWDAAMAHAVREILGHHAAFTGLPPSETVSEPGVYERVLTEYLRPGTDGAFGFLGAGGVAAPGALECADPTPGGQLEWLLGRLRERGLQAHARVLGAGDDVGAGLVVVRTVVPGMLRMTADRELVNFGEARLELVRRAWGVQHALNPRIHPVS